LIECSAEPSVQAGVSRGEQYLINTNLVGTVNCLDHARRHSAAVVFLSTSRVYPIASLRALPLEVKENRYVIRSSARGLGWSSAGISESFSLEGARSLYGTTKLCSELIITEYVASYGLRAIVNRCGVVSGPWQMGKVDQGFVVLWAARHLYGGTLSYQGFGGEGRQVRDVLHVEDLYALLKRQIASLETCNGKIFNVGGGPDRSVSLSELTAFCVARVGRAIRIGQDLNTNAADIPFYVSDNSAVSSLTGWGPAHSLSDTLDDIFAWLIDNRANLEHILR
jgi:CDP-paratose 2-epimerase